MPIQAGPSGLLLTSADAASYCGVTLDALYYATRSGHIPMQRAGGAHGGTRLHQKEDLDAWIDAQDDTRQWNSKRPITDITVIDAGPNGILLTREEAAERLGIAHETLRRELGESERFHMPAIRAGLVELFKEADVEALKTRLEASGGVKTRRRNGAANKLSIAHNEQEVGAA